MPSQVQLRLLVVLMLASATAALRAQNVADGSTIVLSMVTHNFTGDFTVGANGIFTSAALLNPTATAHGS